MPTVQSNGLQIAYEEYGNIAGPTLLMLQGLGMPLTGWPPIRSMPSRSPMPTTSPIRNALWRSVRG